MAAALDELDRQEDEELIAAAAATEGRKLSASAGRGKGRGRGRGKADEKEKAPPKATGTIPPEVIHRRRQLAAEKGKDNFLKKSLSTVDKTEFVQKQVWGQGANGAPFTVKAAKKSEAKDAAPAGLTVAATTSTKRPKKEEPLQEISDLSGASLLSRLLNKSGPSDAGGSLASSFAAQPLESSDGLFSYLSTGAESGGDAGPSSRTAEGEAQPKKRKRTKTTVIEDDD